MGSDASGMTGPDLAAGIDAGQLTDGGLIEGHVGDEPVLLARSAGEVFAVAARCTHYGAPLAEGLLHEGTVRCPWHHACFSLRTGEAVGPPAFDPLARWRVEETDGRLVVTGKVSDAAPKRAATAAAHPRRIVIVGGGAAGFAAAEMLRRRGYAGEITMLSADDAPPCDRPNLSKDYLAGQAPEEWIPLKGAGFYADNRIDLRLRTNVEEIDIHGRRAVAATGESFAYDRLLLATGAEPVRLAIPGADQPHVFTLRSVADSRAIIGQAERARTAVVLGAGFIGLEVAGALRARGLDVRVVAPVSRPMAKVLGPELGDFLRRLHEANGVTFHLGETAERIDGPRVALKGGSILEADLVIVGIGVRPRVELAERAGLEVDRGVVVDAHLETSVAGIYAAGDIARWIDPRTGLAMRVEHWVVAQRQGQTAALAMLGADAPFSAAPFFWSRHYDVSIHYVGHAEEWDAIEVEGSIESRNCLLRYRKGGKVLAVASMGREVDTLRCEAEFEAAAQAARNTSVTAPA
jgi:NADPH-dependent 2,4-dienoyl-CoA reductase/sulfur reductase-like enzyme/nitrite reductase/ring-hydroxylating ferredoxin subunit